MPTVDDAWACWGLDELGMNQRQNFWAGVLSVGVNVSEITCLGGEGCSGNPTYNNNYMRNIRKSSVPGSSRPQQVQASSTVGISGFPANKLCQMWLVVLVENSVP